MKKKNNKGFSYVEVRAVLGITSVITASIVAAAMNAKQKAVDMTQEYVETYTAVEEMTTMDPDIENIMKEGDLNGQ